MMPCDVSPVAMFVLANSVAAVTVVKRRFPGGLAVPDLGFMESTQKLIVS